MRYRREIDGLRALAVIPVVMFHAGFPYVSGGFVGVDVFFVISGYLIAGLIVEEMGEGRFSFAGFYLRRIRRIAPALIVVLSLSTVAACLLMNPYQFYDYSKSLFFSVLFTANFFFESQVGYFAPDADKQPLLHIWSLGVEEQFYILFPLTTFAIFSWFKQQKYYVYALLAGFLVSLLIAEIGATQSPESNFFFTPSRSWEILLGALLASVDHHFKLKGNEAAVIAGLLAVVAAIVIYDDQTPFPSLYALLPTVGAGLVILFARDTIIGSRVLSSPPLVGVGLISYSLYLWHQPLLAFCRLRYGPLDDTQRVAIITASCVLAYLSWRWVERPFRRPATKGGISGRRTMILAGSAGAAIVAAATFGASPAGEAAFGSFWRQSASLMLLTTYDLLTSRPSWAVAPISNCTFRTEQVDDELRTRARDCYRKYGPGIFILGDSHAIGLFEMAAIAPAGNRFIVGVSRGGCRPHTPAPKCQYEAFQTLMMAEPKLAKAIVYEEAGFYLLSRDGVHDGSRHLFEDIPVDQSVPDYEINKGQIEKVVRYLEPLAFQTKLIWFGPHIEVHIPRPAILEKGCARSYSLRGGQYDDFKKLDDYLSQRLATSPVRYVSQLDLLHFDMSRDFMTCNQIFWRDGDHFSADGELRFGQRMRVLENLGLSTGTGVALQGQDGPPGNVPLQPAATGIFP